MSDEAPPPTPDPRYDPAKVMFNGAAIALVTSLTNGIQQSLTAEIKAAELRQNKLLDDAVRALSGDVIELEAWRRSEMDARQRRDGQLSVLQAIGSFLVRYDKVILGIGIGIATGVAAAVFGVGS